MGFIKNTMVSAKALPKGVWLAALVVPGGLTAIGLFFIAKGTYKTFRGKK